MRLTEDILNAKYFPLGSRERLKATLISLMLILAVSIMIIDVYESVAQKYYAMSIIESSSATVLILLYILFPKKTSLQNTIYVALAVIGFLFVSSLTIHGANPEFALFWLATLPVYIFFFLGLKLGIRWTIAVVITLLMTAVNAFFEWSIPLYKTDFLIQITIGYIAISYLLYTLEKERQGYEDNLLTALKEKEVLLKEVHHRTKNNMQIMIGLLDTQSFKIDDVKYKRMFQSHVKRLKAMSLVHKHLYVGENYETVDIHKYLGEIIKNLQSITSHTIVSDIGHVTLNMNVAMNLGLIFNEAVVNAIEHAYEEGETKNIEVSFKCKEESCLLSVKDYGKGFDAKKSHNTLGVTLMQDISRSLKNGHIEINTKEGTEIKVYCTLEDKVNETT